MLNLGQGVAWDGWYGRGVRSNHPEDYREYIKGSDIVSFDIYPVASTDRDISGKLWYVAKGVERLSEWTDGTKTVWDCIECSRINSTNKATPLQIRAEVWMSLIHGSRGLIYFVHEWNPKFDESAVLNDLQTLRAVSEINHRIQRLAPVLNSPTVTGKLTVTSANNEVPIASMVKEYNGTTYIFAVAMRSGSTTATFKLPSGTKPKHVTAIDENRAIAPKQNTFEDTFSEWQTHLYRID